MALTSVTKEDIEKVHSRLNAMVEEQTKSRIAIGQMEITLKMMPLPPARPCPELAGHLTEHKESKRLWKAPIVAALIHLIELGIVALTTWFFVR